MIPIIGQRMPLAMRSEIDMTKRDAEILIAMVPMMAKLALGFFCLKCNSGVRANNHPEDEKWIVECECSLRILQRRDPK